MMATSTCLARPATDVAPPLEVLSDESPLLSSQWPLGVHCRRCRAYGLWLPHMLLEHLSSVATSTLGAAAHNWS